MKIEIIEHEFSICKLENLSQFDFTDEFYFIGKTDEETSLVCTSKSVPQNAGECENGWRAFRICGTLEFSLIGTISKLSALLADNGIGIFALSTYNTDYILTKSENFENAVNTLNANGYEIKR